MIGNDKLEEQREIGTQADRRRLEFVEKEAELAQEHGRDLTEDAIDATYSKLNVIKLNLFVEKVREQELSFVLCH